MSKTALQIRADLRLDLKDSGALWSDAELNRCIERAVSDFNRYLPDEKTYELSLQFTVDDESVTFPAAIDADRIVAAASLATTADGDTLTIAAQPDVPRPLTLTITDASAHITGLSLIVRGSDKYSKALEETFHWYKGLGVLTGKEYFKTVNEVEVNQIDGNSSGETLDLGIGAYTNVWVYLANSPIKADSDSGTDAVSNSLTRDTDYYIDYMEGKVKAISGGDIAATEACTFDYTKMQIGIDLDSVPKLIRVQRVEYPVGDIPQSFIQGDTFGKKFFVTGMGESESQKRMGEDEHIRIYYDAEHVSPNDYAPGTIPDFLENTVEMLAGAYALLVEALQYNQQAVTDFASARTELATIAHTAYGTALTNAAAQIVLAATALGKINSDSTRTYLTDADAALDAAVTALTKVTTYLESNTNEDSKFWLTKITTDIAGLRTAILASLDASNAYLDVVGAATTGDLAVADLARANYMGATANYVDVAGDTEPGIKGYLTSGDALLNAITVGGEGTDVARAYAEYARTAREALVSAHEEDRRFKADNATKRTNAAMVYASEAAQRLSNLRSYIEQADGWGRVAQGFIAEAAQRVAEAGQRVGIADRYLAEAAQRTAAGEAYISEANSRLADMDRYVAEADRYIGIANQNLQLAEKFRTDALERRNEVYSIWRDRKQYIGDFTAGSVRQMPQYQ